MNFIRSFQSEWLKKKRSLASWLTIVGAFFTPAIVLVARIKNHALLAKSYGAEDFWLKHWHQSWESMAILLLPIGVVLATGLIAQIEYKNNAWKQLHATPQSYTVIFFAKLAVIFVMLAEVFALFNLGVYLSAIVPALVFADVPLPSAPIPYELFLQQNLRYFVEALPVLALQYMISLHFKNFLVPVGAGFLIWILGVGLLSWEFSFIFPYVQGGLDFLRNSGNLKRQLPVNPLWLSAAYSIVFLIAGYALYVMKDEKG